MHRRALLGALLSGLASACAKPTDPVVPAPRGTPTVHSRGEARARLAELGRRYESLMREHGIFEWSRYAGKLAEGADAQKKMAALRADERDVFTEASGILERFGGAIVSPRRAALWNKGALGLKLLGDPRATELADQLEAVINGHHYELDGKTVTRGELGELRRSDDARVRRRTRQLEHQLHVKAAPIAKDLLRRRKELAKELGVPSFYQALLEVRGSDLPTLDRVLGDLDRRTRPAFFASFSHGRLAFGRNLLLPWDIDWHVKTLSPVPDERFPADRALSTVFSVYRAFGIDLERSKLSVTLRDFAFGGQTIAIHTPDDVRLVVRPMPGLKAYSVLLHELGHAFGVTRITAEEPLYKGYEWVPGLEDPAYAEGLAEIFARLLDEPRVLTELLGLSGDDAARVVRARKLETLANIRRALVSVNFERAALEQPDANLDQLSIDIERRFSGTLVPGDAEPVWAGTPFLATYPVYIQSYQLASVLAVQVREALKSRFGSRWISPEAGAWLAERLVADGSRWSLRDKLVMTTGSPLDTTPLVHFLLRGPEH